MASPVPHPAQQGRSDTRPPDADPAAIRACLGTDLAAVFDGHWERVLEEAKESRSLSGIHDLLAHWRHIAYQELRAPGSYDRLMAKADAISTTGNGAVGSVSGADVRSRIAARLVEAGLPDPRDGR